jgi:surface polysaccharide O-acyltransferase-like enzyme
MSRNLTIDILKVALAFFVVGLHGSFLLDIDPVVGYSLKQGLFRSAVPLFLIISGYYFYRMDTFEKELKFIGRLVVLYTVWFIIYIPISYNRYYFDLLSYNFFNGERHLWYLIHTIYALFLLCLLKRVGVKKQVAIIAMLAVGGIVLQYNNAYDFFAIKKLRDICLYRNALFFCLPFIYLGYISHRYKEKTASATLIFAGIALVLAESYMNHFTARSSFDILVGLYALCPAIFLWAIKTRKTTSVKYLSEISVAVYLVHPYFLAKIPFDAYVDNIYHRYTLLTLSAFGLSVAASLVLILLNKKLKYIL